MQKVRLDTSLEANGAEFLVLGQLLLRKVVAYKAYMNFPGYDLLAVNPSQHRVCRIQVKSRIHSGAAGFPLKNFDCEFLIFTALNRGKPSKNAESTVAVPPSEPEFYVFPIDVLKQVHRDGNFPKVLLKDIPDPTSYLNRWDLILDYLTLSA